MYFFIAGVTLCVSVSAQSELTNKDLGGQTETKPPTMVVSSPTMVSSRYSAVAVPRISIRQGGTDLTKTNPLILIDNVETSSGLEGVLPETIESITILKNAMAVELYGLRGADGVILITTKLRFKNLDEPEENTIIAETENPLKPDCATTQSKYENTSKIETDNIEVTETENSLEPDWVILRLEDKDVSEIETDNMDETGTENPFSDLKIYPNPFFGTIRLAGAEGCILKVIAEDGIVVLTQKLTSQDEIIRLEHLRSGVYYFCVDNGKQTKTVKGVKSN